MIKRHAAFLFVSHAIRASFLVLPSIPGMKNFATVSGLSANILNTFLNFGSDTTSDRSPSGVFVMKRQHHTGRYFAITPDPSVPGKPFHKVSQRVFGGAVQHVLG